VAAGALSLCGCSQNRTAVAQDAQTQVDSQQTGSAVSQGEARPAENSPEVIDILEKHIAAIGGREAQKAIKSVEVERESALYNNARKTREVRDKASGRFYSKTVDPHGNVETGFDGTRAWQKSPFFRGYLADSDPQAKALSRKRRELYDYRENGQHFTRQPDETVDGKLLIVLQTQSADMDPLGRELPVKYYFDSQTFLLRRIVTGSEITQTIELNDYRQVDGVLVPFETKTINPNITLTSKVKRIQHNAPFDPTIFEYEPGASPPTSPGATSSAKPVGAKAVEPAAPPLGPDEVLPERMRLDTFELVWSAVNDSYWDPTFGGLDWKSIHDQYLPQVKATARNEAFHELLNDMLAQLDRSHFNVQPPDRAQGLHTKAAELKNGSVGLDLRWLDGALVVFDTKKDFPAVKAGIKRGFRILRINGKDADELLAAYRAKRKGFPLRNEIEHVRAAIDELSGAPGTELTLQVSGAKGAPREIKLTRRAKPVDQVMEFESRKIADGIGYIRFSIFMGDVLTQVKEALRQMGETSGLVIDLRGNPGGIGHLPPSLAGILYAEPGTLGSSTSRYGKQEFHYAGGGKEANRGRIAILVDEMTGSAAEVFSGGLQDAKRATIIGSTTAGAVLPSMVKMLPTGGTLQHVIADFKTPSGRLLEGRGVIPDIAVKPTRKAWLDGKDPALERAIQFLRSSA
jgi:carboxyl-terminal processing protease